MEIDAIDHVNLRIPEDGTDAAVDFYGDRLGFDIEGLERYERDEIPFFDVRLAPGCVIHLWPTTAFEAPTGDNFNHVALRVGSDVDTLKNELAAADIEIDDEHDAPLGATGRAPAVYLTDPFDYRIELKTPTE